MSARPAKHMPLVINLGIAANTTSTLLLGTAVTEFSLRVVDATTFAPVAYTVAMRANASGLRHFAATDAPYQERDIGPLRAPLELLVGAAVAAIAELTVWRRAPLASKRKVNPLESPAESS